MPRKILMIVGDFVEDYEVMVPFQTLLTVGHEVHEFLRNMNSV
jgi:protease I